MPVIYVSDRKKIDTRARTRMCVCVGGCRNAWRKVFLS